MVDEPPATILVVDDTPPNVKLLRLILNEAGYRVLEASSGQEALATLKSERPDAMILDVRMPGMTGYEVCTAVRSDPEFSALPVIMVTALSLLEERIKGIEAGATDFIVKPFNKKELLARIHASLEMARTKNCLVGQLPGAVILADPAWKPLGITPVAAALLGIPAAEIMKLDVSLLFGAAEREMLADGVTPADFILQLPSRALRGRQTDVVDPSGRLYMHVIMLSEMPA